MCAHSVAVIDAGSWTMVDSSDVRTFGRWM